VDILIKTNCNLELKITLSIENDEEPTVLWTEARKFAEAKNV